MTDYSLLEKQMDSICGGMEQEPHLLVGLVLVLESFHLYVLRSEVVVVNEEKAVGQGRSLFIKYNKVIYARWELGQSNLRFFPVSFDFNPLEVL